MSFWNDDQPKWAAALQGTLNEISVKQDRILLVLNTLSAYERKNMVDLTNLTAAVAAEKTVEDSAIALINGLAAKIQALASQPTVDPAQLQALADQMTTEQKALAAAVTANTPAAQ